MRKYSLVIYVLLFALFTKAQSPQFTWMSGYMLGNQPTLYAPKGVTTATCMPGPRNRGVSWKDNSGNLWMFGGTGNDASNIYGIVSDLWKYDISTNMWTWLKGDSLVGNYSSYGTQGVSNNINKPAFRDRSVSWTHKNGDLYMFGGLGRDNAHNTGTLNDLWKYNISLNQWTWVGGSNLRNQPGVYGTKGVSSASNYPGSRMEGTTWVDTAGNFWLFGGNGYGIITGDGYMNDLWKRNPTNGRWTWVSGATSASFVSRYGTKGVPSSLNTPGARSNGVSWMDADGNLWLFGGKGHTSSGFGFLNDVWKFDIASSQWTWITGDTILNKTGKYGLLGVPSATNTPGSRDGALGWSSNNSFYLTGGYGYDKSTDGALNDFWKFDVITSEWTWLGGSDTRNQVGSFGTKTIFSYSNVPGPRYFSVNWKDNNGVFWMFGGNANSFYGPSGANGDLWKIDLCSGPIAPTNSTNNSDLIVCQGSSAVLSAVGVGTLKWYNALVGGTALSSGSTYTTAPLITNATYYVQDSTCDKSARTAITITVNPAPTLTVNSGAICIGQSFTINSGGALSYTYSAGPIVTPTTNMTYTISGNGPNGCIGKVISTVTVHALPLISVASASICNGKSYTFVPSGANTYTYSSGTAIVSPTTNTNYTVSGTDIYGCENTVSTSIVVNSLPTLSVNSGTICAGNSFTIIPSGANTYTYSSATAVVSPTSNTNYTISGTDVNGCGNTVSTSVIVNALPTLSVNSATICAGNSFTMIPTGANTYTYSNGSNIVYPMVNTSYSITGTDINGCVSNEVVSSVTVNSLPILSVNDGTICSGQSFTLMPTGATSFSVQGGAAAVSPTANATYTVVGYTNGCASNQATVVVTVNSTPTISVTSGTICSGQSFTIASSGASTYNYSSGSAVVSPTANAIYNVVGISSLGCVSSNTAVSAVTVNSLPVITVNSGAICFGNSFTIIPTGANTYTYSTGLATITPPTTLTFSVTGTDINGCISNEVSNTVTVNPLPTITVNSGTICSGSSFTIIPTGANTYVYSSGSSVVSPITDATFTVTGMDVNGCTNTAESTVTVNLLPSLVVNSGVICAGYSFTIIPTGASTYTYSTGSSIITPASNITYTVTGTDINGCISNETINTVTVNILPTISVNSGTICSGMSFTIIPNGASTYSYSSGANIVSPIINETFTVTGTDVNGCENIAFSSVTVNSLPLVTATTNNTLLCTGQTATLTALGADGYTWNTGETTMDISISPTVTTTYTVIGTDINGCSNTYTISQNIDLCTGINKAMIFENLKIYPNPTKGLFTIDLQEQAHIIITNIFGQIIESEIVSTGKKNFDVHNYANGIYFVKIVFDDFQQTVKVIKE